jgi:signal transduction histidine kinase
MTIAAAYLRKLAGGDAGVACARRAMQTQGFKPMRSEFRSTVRWLRICAVLAAGGVWHVGRAAEFQSSLAEDGRSILVDSPGLLTLRAGFSAVVERGNRRAELVSTAATGNVELVSETAETPFGTAAMQRAGLRFDEDGCELLLRYGRIPGVPGVTVQSGVRNTGAEPLRLVSTSPVSMAGTRTTVAGKREFLETRLASMIDQPLGTPSDNLSVSKEPIRIFGENFARGIGCHAPSDMRFPLDGRFARFQCVAGVDDSGSGSVTFEVHADGNKVFASGRVLRGQPGRVIDLDVTGVKELRLVVTDAGDGTGFDWANWADASLKPVTGIDSVLPPADAPAIHLASPLANWLISPLLGQAGAMVTRAMDRAFDPITIREAGGLYDADGRGLFFGPVGTPVTYLSARLGSAGNQRATLDLDCAMDSVEVLPGEIRWGQQAVILLESPQLAQERWISWVADSHRARPPRDPMSGWLSWYWLGSNVSENNLMQVADFAAKSGGKLRPSVIQIDDGYQNLDGQAGLNGRFPSATQGLASKITASGAVPGLMVRLEMNTQEGLGRFLGNIRHAAENGFRYFKITDPGGQTDSAGKQTRFEKKRAFYQAIRQAAGEDGYLLAAGNGADRASVGSVDACRVRGSTNRHEMVLGLDDTLRSLALNRRWFTVDTDCYYLATDIDDLPPVTGGWPMVHTWLSITGLIGGNAMTSDPWHWDSMAPFLRHTEILTPPARETARAIDIGTSAGLPRIVGQVSRPWGDWTVALLWNPASQAKAVTLDFAKAGMNANLRYAVWSFWENRFLGIAEKSWTTPVMEPTVSQHLCFTPIHGDPLKPVLIGSNLHVWSGAAEFERVTALHGAMEIHFTDAGARAGDLFVHCESRPLLRSVSGCKVGEITNAGEHIWRVSIADRQRGAVQRIELGVEAPITRQPWFWALLVLLASSGVFGLWRYLEKFRIEQQVTRLKQKGALDEERARIARDLHDELGANLARIGLLTELADQAIGDPDKTRHQLGRILTAARGITRQLDSVVWAVDPANDTIESLTRYLHGHAEDYLVIAGIRCRFEGMDLPDLPLSSSLRHHLLMITKEALHNVVKHAAASTVTLRLHHDAGILTLEIEDDGKGIGKPEGHRHGNGLNNIRKRAMAAGGTCEFQTGSGGTGTLVRLCIPVKAGNIS